MAELRKLKDQVNSRNELLKSGLQFESNEDLNKEKVVANKPSIFSMSNGKISSREFANTNSKP